jgi:23S rRNA (uracil1939-C5)-methyltransferase
VNRLLVESLLAGARARGVGTFADLFAGAGNFALPLLALGCRGVAVESSELAVDGARKAAAAQSLPFDGFVRADATNHARRLAKGGQRFDLVVIDPPRAGVKRGLDQMARLCAGWIALCSCNPVTLARDLRTLVDLGFVIESVEAFDMFPHTHHLETLVWLRKAGVAAASGVAGAVVAR